MGDAEKLVGQIGNYSNSSVSRSEQQEKDALFSRTRLEQGGIDALYEGIMEYKLNYEALIEHSYPDETVEDEKINKRLFFREKFAEFIAKKNDSSEGEYQGDPNVRATNPELATISMREFLGEEGMKLYQLALAEEMNSQEYMDAVFRASTTHFEGEKWAERPVVLVAGPSGCGKSYAAKAAIEKANAFLAKNDNDFSGNDVVAVDGGIAREVSQMRKLVIQAANNKGYPGIKDLHSQSKVLEGVKDRMQKAVLHPTTQVGVVIPETFSDFTNPANKKKNLLKSINELPGAKPIFCRVDGENPSIFQRIVAFMGSRRAWKTSGFEEEIPLDLNNTKIPESKAYGASGFRFGQLGSLLAELWFKKHAKIDLSMKIINDLVLKRPEPLDSQNWVDAEQGEPGTRMISKRVFDQWEGYLVSLPAEDRENPPLTLEQFAETIPSPSVVQTSGEMDLAIAKEAIRKRAIVVQNTLDRAKAKDPQNPNIAMLEEKLGNLQIIRGKLDLIDDSNKDGIVELRTQLRKNISDMDTAGHFGFFSRTEKSLKRAVKALDKIIAEISEEEKLSKSPVQSYKEYKEKYLSQQGNFSLSREELSKEEQPEDSLPPPS